MRDNIKIERRKIQLIEMTAEFCDKFLDDEYRRLSQQLIEKMGCKRNVPFLSGKIENWAAAIIYALGQINCLFDKSFEPYVKATDICDFFGTSQSTVSQKSKKIRDMFRMSYFDEEFATDRMKEGNPLKDLVIIDGLILDINDLIPKILAENLEDNKEIPEKDVEKKRRFEQRTLDDIS